MSTNPLATPVAAISGLALTDARNVLEAIKRRAAGLHLALEDLETHIDQLESLLDPIPPAALSGEALQ